MSAENEMCELQRQTKKSMMITATPLSNTQAAQHVSSEKNLPSWWKGEEEDGRLARQTTNWNRI
jgi:hypothetical protein